jgi:hypothetical protein
MADRSNDRQVAGHIHSIATRAERDADRLVAMLIRGCWPKAGDCSVPAALEWVRRWGPRGLPPAPPTCSCAAGPCSVCN